MSLAVAVVAVVAALSLWPAGRAVAPAGPLTAATPSPATPAGPVDVDGQTTVVVFPSESTPTPRPTEPSTAVVVFPSEWTPPQPTEPSDDVDRQIMADVVDFAFPVGGPSMLRQMRVEQAIFSIQADDCGGKYRFDPDYTGARLDQLRYPYLDLIEQKGFSEPEPAFGDRYDSRAACASKSLPSWPSVLRLSPEWDQVTTKVWNRPAIQTALTAAGKCLESKTGRQLGATGAAKVEGFFGLLERIDLTAQGLKNYAGYYVTCMADYSAAMQVALQAEASAAFAKHKDVLVAFAQELEDAGYVP